MHSGSSRIYHCILDLPQHVSASHCHHKRVTVTSEATQAIYILDVHIYGLRSVQCDQLSRDVTNSGTDPSIHSWLRSSTTDHSGRIVIHTYP
jgi:hypothetical protein